MLSRHQKVTYYFSRLPNLPIISLLLLSLFLFRKAFDIYFFQDDFFFFSITKIKSLLDILRFFIPRNDVQFYRPLTSEIYYLFSRWIFDLQPFGYHLIAFLFFLGTIILVYKIALRLFKLGSYAFLFTFFWATSPIHQDSLYWIANFSYIAVNFLFLLGFYIFLEKIKHWKKILLLVFLYILGLLSNELMIFFPFILLSYRLLLGKSAKEEFSVKTFSLFATITIVYLCYRFIFFPPDIHLYKFNFDLSVVSSLRWFFLFFIGWAETVKHHMVRFYLFSHEFASSFFWEMIAMISNLVVILGIFIVFPLYLHFKEKNLIVWIQAISQKLVFSLIWITFNISPIIFISSQISPHRGSLAFFGFLLLLFFLAEKQLGRFFNKYPAIFFLITLVWLTNSILVTRLNERVHWVRHRSELSKQWISAAKESYPTLDKGTQVVLWTDDSEVKYALANGLAVKVMYGNYLLDVTFSTTDTEEQTPHILAQPSLTKNAAILIINQIRGDERCCTPGSIELIKALREDKIISNLPFAWALRFDALENGEYINTLKNSSGEQGLLLEVTPNLAAASGVAYRGKSDGTDWYYAKNAFLVGYSLDERKKIIDTLFHTFKQKFGFYPSFTVSWMIDAWSLSYIQKTYNVQLHELTKEQYETDSYTLYGGIFNAPYYPSINHPLIPGYSKERLDLVVIRQTISDILQNYGVIRAFYTSQPNDYLASSEKLDISYFKALVDESIGQSTGPQFGVLGFENSFSWEKYGEEYLRQLRYLAQLVNDKKIFVRKPTEYVKEFRQKNSENLPFYLAKNFYPGKDNGVLWYFGENYRARVIKKDNQVILDDLRNFALGSDPYKQSPSQSDYAYWIIPYLIDGSQQYTLTSTAKETLKKKGLSSSGVLPDTKTNPFGIILGEGDFEVKPLERGVEIIFDKKEKHSVQLLPKEIIIDQDLEPLFTSPFNTKITDLYSSQKSSIFYLDRHFDMQIQISGEQLKLGFIAKEIFIPLFSMFKNENEFHLFPLLASDHLDLLSPLFQPDRSYLPADKEKSVFYWNNKEAVAGRNPVRLFILPLNSLGRSTKVDKVQVKLSDPVSTNITYPDDYSYRITPWFIDISATQSIQTDVSLEIDGQEVFKDIPIEFITDCQKDAKACIYSPGKLLKYVKILLGEQKMRVIQALSNLR